MAILSFPTFLAAAMLAAACAAASCAQAPAADAPPAAVASGMPSPVATNAAKRPPRSDRACPEADALAAVAGTAVQPIYPRLARVRGETGSSTIRVSLAADGTVREAAVATSSGSPLLDESALRAVALTNYRPECVAGRPVEGSYEFVIVFSVDARASATPSPAASARP